MGILNPVRKRAILLTVLLMLVSSAAVLLVQYPALVDPYKVTDDLRQYFWMARFQDRSLFPDDHLFYQVKRVRVVSVLGVELVFQFVSLGFSLFYQLASVLVSPLVFNKVLPFGLMWVSLAYLFRLGRLLKDDLTGILMSLFFIVYSLCAPDNISLLTGLPRSFQFPLLIAFLYMMKRRSSVGMAVILVIDMLIYAPLFFISAAAWALSFVHLQGGRIRIDLHPRRVAPLLVAGLIAGLLFLPAVFEQSETSAPERLALTDLPVWENPTYGPAGRLPIFVESAYGVPLYLLVGYGGLMRHDGFGFLAPLLLIALMVWLVLGFEGFRIGREAYALLIGSLLMWCAAWLVALVTGGFLLRYPFKFTSAVIPVWFFLQVMLNLDKLLAAGLEAWKSRGGRVAILLTGAGILMMITGLSLRRVDLRMSLMGMGAVMLIVGGGLVLRWRMRRFSPRSSCPPVIGRTARAWPCFLVGALCLLYFPRMGSRTIDVPQAQRDVCEYAAALPPDTLLAGDPAVMDNVLLFSQRRVLFSAEISYVGGNRVLDFYEAYYADSPQTITDFCDRYGVDYLVVNRDHFGEAFLQAGRFFYEPYNTAILEMAVEGKDFYLARADRDRIVFQSGPLFVWPCARFAESD